MRSLNDNDNGDGDYFPHYFDNVCLNCRWRSWGLAPFSSHCPTFSLKLTGVGRHDKDLWKQVDDDDDDDDGDEDDGDEDDDDDESDLAPQFHPSSGPLSTFNVDNDENFMATLKQR